MEAEDFLGLACSFSDFCETIFITQKTWELKDGRKKLLITENPKKGFSAPPFQSMALEACMQCKVVIAKSEKL